MKKKNKDALILGVIVAMFSLLATGIRDIFVNLLENCVDYNTAIAISTGAGVIFLVWVWWRLSKLDNKSKKK